ncbi:hypothetical protein QBC33DRAFT_564432 [Phialemonium atrogriseum]|uniref:Uncharacterized protein n=1 Tax=Phialemonium atrogriseum TaxID=1093897 RepID=A0AAJ0BNY1_9PEZI|nr:uncharacterized protein QBC33DRAFT_564432 [Phialemonium atrogriseum]KAK1761784.1 hypothetical protein QBC33DRAFT_564432 [Phialemonium atrogriseum]
MSPIDENVLGSKLRKPHVATVATEERYVAEYSPTVAEKMTPANTSSEELAILNGLRSVERASSTGS